METNSKIAFLTQFPLFDVLTPDERVLLSQMVQLKKKPRHSYIYYSSEASDTLFFLLKGVVKIGTHSTDEKEVIKNILHPMAMFGELSVVGEKCRADFAMSMSEEVQYFSLSVENFKTLMQKNPRLNNKVLNLMGDRLRRAENRLESLIFKDARTRIVDFIRDSANKRGKQIGFEMLIKHSLTQQDIANITGTSRQTVTSVLNELKKLNLIHFTRKSILVRDMAKLS